MLLNFDMQKAYVRVNWLFLDRILEAFGFGDNEEYGSDCVFLLHYFHSLLMGNQ